MNYIQEIIRRYFTRKYPKDLELKIQCWLCNDEKTELKNAALSDLWNEIKVNSRNYNMENSWNKIANLLNFKNIKVIKKRYSYWYVAASVLCCVLIGSTWLWRNEIFDQTMQVIATANGEYKNIILPDGSSVYLYPSSQISYKKDFDDTIRYVSLQGEAYFNVKPIQEKPFIVESKNLTTKVLGTKFNIKNYQEDIQASAYLERGSIQVSIQQNLQVFILKPKEKIIYDKLSKQTELLFNRNKKQADLSFHNASIHDIMNMLERQFNIQIALQGNTSEKYTIEFNPKASIKDILDALCTLDEELSWEKKNQSFIIRTKQSHNEN